MESPLDLRVKVTNLKTGEIVILPPKLVEKALEEAKQKYLDSLLFGYDIKEDD